MKILCIGAGSMGRRRLRDLTYLAPGDVILCEKSPDRCKQVASAFGVPAYTDLDEAFAQKPDVVSISTPPAFHEDPLKRAMEQGTHVFAEVPFVLNLEKMREIARDAGSYPKVQPPVTPSACIRRSGSFATWSVRALSESRC